MLQLDIIQMKYTAKLLKITVIILKWLIWIFHRVTRPNDADGMANSVDPDQIAPLWVCTVCPDLFVRNFRNITVL